MAVAMHAQKTVALTGNEAAAQALRQIEPDVVAAYPITPQTEIVQLFSTFVSDGLVKTEFVAVESEHSAIRAGLLREEDLPTECQEVLGAGRHQRIDGMVKDLIINSWEKPEISMSPPMAHATNKLREFLFENIYMTHSADKEKDKIYRLMSSLVESSGIVRKTKFGVMGFPPQ